MYRRASARTHERVQEADQQRGRAVRDSRSASPVGRRGVHQGPARASGHRLAEHHRMRDYLRHQVRARRRQGQLRERAEPCASAGSVRQRLTNTFVHRQEGGHIIAHLR